MFRSALLFLSLICLAAGLATAASDPMVGDWKLNPQKSTLVDEMKVASLGGNKYSFDFGGPAPETVVVDGSDQPGNGGTTLAVTEGSPEQWTVVRKKDGRMQLRGIWKLTQNGSALHDDYTELGDNGKTTHVDYIYARRGEGSTFAGDWVSTSQQIDTEYVVNVRPYEGDGLSITAASEGVVKNVRFDGKDYPNAGSQSGRVTSARRVNERTIELTDKRADRVLGTEEISISEDGKILTMTIRVPKRSDPNVLVFDRK